MKFSIDQKNIHRWVLATRTLGSSRCKRVVGVGTSYQYITIVSRCVHCRKRNMMVKS